MPRFDAEDLDDDIPTREPPKRSRSTWLIVGGVAAALLVLVGCLFVAEVLNARRNAELERDMAMVAQLEAEEMRLRAEQEGREPLVDRRPFDGAGGPRAVVNVQALADAFIANDARAAEKYTGRRARYVGIVRVRVTHEDGTSVLLFATAQEDKNPVRAAFPPGEREKIAKLAQGSAVEFDGRCEGWDRDAALSVIDIRDCRIVPGPPKKGPH